MAVGVSLGREMERHFNLPGGWLESSLQVAYVIGRYRKPDKVCHIFAERAAQN